MADIAGKCHLYAQSFHGDSGNIIEHRCMIFIDFLARHGIGVTRVIGTTEHSNGKSDGGSKGKILDGDCPFPRLITGGDLNHNLRVGKFLSVGKMHTQPYSYGAIL